MFLGLETKKKKKWIDFLIDSDLFENIDLISKLF